MRMGGSLGIVISCALIATANAATAQTSPVVVELFTSQGCAACPPADKVVEQLAGRDDVIALALHVDYWDYIGWADSFGQSQFSARQKNYARNNGRASIYTPQMIIGGLDEVQGSAVMRVMNLIQDHRAKSSASPVHVTLTPDGDGKVMVRAESADALPRAADVQVVRYKDAATVSISGGENAGRQITYHNIVTAWDIIAQWDGLAPFQQLVSSGGDAPLVVIIQEQGQGAILAAARHR
ncbi:MAG: DUF1223 domain-containing protein [Rhodobacteraceae bacterium]|nr:DUF1223 domain-containing protein [Paracoccaceae bacterium]